MHDSKDLNDIVIIIVCLFVLQALFRRCKEAYLTGIIDMKRAIIKLWSDGVIRRESQPIAFWTWISLAGLSAISTAYFASIVLFELGGTLLRGLS